MLSENFPMAAFLIYIIPVSWYIYQGYRQWRRAEQRQLRRQQRQ